jgi:hypothetical protein
VEIAPGEPGQPAGRGGGQLGGHAEAVVSAAAYLMLFLLGVAEGVLGCFYYNSGPGSLAAIAFAAGIFVTCVLAGWGMRRPAGALVSAIGWLAASFVLATGTKGGSVVITNNGPGKWFLFGGSIAAVAGTLLAFVLWSRLPRRGGRRS